MSSPRPLDRSTKRHKGDGGPSPPEGYHGGYGQQPPQGRYQQPPYGPGGASMGQQSGYMWQHGQYGNSQPPPHSWGHGSAHPTTMHGQRGGPSMTPDRTGYSSAYPRGPPPMQGSRRGGKPGPPSRPPSKTPDAGSVGPQPGYQAGWGHPQGTQWPQYQYGGGAPSAGWQGNGPPMHQPPGYGNPVLYGANNSPTRGGAPGRPRSSPEMMGGYASGPPGAICQSADNPDIDMYHSRGVGPPHDDDGNSSTGNRDSKDKGRGSYKCGRCGVPKKGHVCPYQPKLSRRPGEPLPEMRSAAIQVEMDEFMTLRRLNLKIQGFPESYASEPYMEDDMVVGEPANPHGISSASTPGEPPRVDLMTVPGSSRPTLGLPPNQDQVSMLGSPIRSSPISDDPIAA